MELREQPPPQALRFLHGRGERETRVTGDEPQGTMGRVQTAGEASLARCLLPAFLCAHIFIQRETSGYEAATGVYGRICRFCLQLNKKELKVILEFEMDFKKLNLLLAF